jgi:hypothetical protein
MNDAFHRLKNRSRATVKPRDYSLTESENDSITKFSQDAITELEPPETVANPENDIMTKFSQDKITELLESEPMVVRRTIRLEEEIDEALASVCRAERITRDTFLEAAYSICSQQPELMELIVTEARSRRKQRQESGEKRKYETMKRKFTD